MKTTYQKDEYVRYAVNGVCLVEDIRKMPELKRDALFYVLRPIADRKSTYFIPVDNEKLTAKLRPLLTKDEIETLIDQVQITELTWIDDRKERMEQYHTVLRECDMRQLVELACTLYLQRQQMLLEGKKMAPSDENVLHQAEALVDNELSVVLGIPISEVGAYIRGRVGIE